MTRYVYLMRSSVGTYKVGIATNVYKRLKSLQTNNGDKVEIVTAKRVADAAMVERSIHSMLKDHRLNGGREWFKLTCDQAIEIAILINRNVETTQTDIGELKVMIAEHSIKQQRIVMRLIELSKKLEIESAYTGIVPVGTDSSLLPDTKKPSAINKAAVAAELRLKRLAAKEKLEDEMYKAALRVVRHEQNASTSLLQRKLSIGYGRASRLIDRMELDGYVGPLNGIHREYINIPMNIVEISKSIVGV